MNISFNVPCVPVAQPRQRHRIVKSKNHSFVSNYTPKNDPVNTFKASIRLAASQVYKGPPLDCPLEIVIEAIFPRPKGLIWKTKPMPRKLKTTKPDCDNVAKAVYDALNGLIQRDDALFCITKTVKYIAAGNEQPHVFITISTLEDLK